ncbi:hypothetical protein RHGRI_026753 [Rhododendron griersonianum]|uniref:Uncharacterized protein n=1 Tax=Rhododendron griersonianum TaxID=479676 RepID=A0AAV6IXG7_9ERIC|nr:hypothetical protein RHGRI_026753 [Rhododendron griersonianum]
MVVRRRRRIFCGDGATAVVASKMVVVGVLVFSAGGDDGNRGSPIGWLANLWPILPILPFDWVAVGCNVEVYADSCSLHLLGVMKGICLMQEHYLQPEKLERLFAFSIKLLTENDNLIKWRCDLVDRRNLMFVFLYQLFVKVECDAQALALYEAQVSRSYFFFDPAPRGKSLSAGTPEVQKAFGKFLRMSDVLLLTSEEVESLTRIRNPVLAGQELLKKGLRAKWVNVKMGAKGSTLITMSSISCAPAFKSHRTNSPLMSTSRHVFFVAAIAFGFIHNMPTVNILTIANPVGAAAATAMCCGAGRNIAILKQLIELVKDENLHKDDKFWNDLTRKIGFSRNYVSNQNAYKWKQYSVQSGSPAMLESAGLNKVVPS